MSDKNRPNSRNIYSGVSPTPIQTWWLFLLVVVVALAADGRGGEEKTNKDTPRCQGGE
jgi:hypothetical protein